MTKRCKNRLRRHRRIKHKVTLAQRRWFNRAIICPQRKLNRLIRRHDECLRIALLKCRQWGTILPLRPDILTKAMKNVIRQKHEADSCKFK